MVAEGRAPVRGDGTAAEYQRVRAAPQLRPYVASCAGYRVWGPAGTHQGVPSGYLTCLLTLSGSVELAALPDRSRPPASFTTAVAGLHARPSVVAHDGLQYGMQLDLTWQGARTLLGVPAGELAGNVVSLTELLGPEAERLRERLADESGWAERFRVTARFLAARIAACEGRAASGPPSQVTHAWRLLAASGGLLPVAELARETGLGRRHLAERFRQETGLTPKTAGRVLRFRRACEALRTPGATPAATASACGFADQAHLAREFRALAGTTVTAWRADLPFVQDPE